MIEETMIQIAPSILSADFSKLGEELHALDKAGADQIHIDVMDGHFVPNLTIGPCVVRSLRPHTTLPFDVHLMVTNPSLLIDSFVKAGADVLTVHAEISPHISLLKTIKDKGVQVGISLNPDTSLDAIFPYLPDVHRVLIMTVQPGFGGQSFRSDQLEKIRQLEEIKKKKNFSFLIAVDGGITPQNASLVKQAGADILIAGSSIFKDGPAHYQTNINALRMLGFP